MIDFHRRNNGRRPRVRHDWDKFQSIDHYLGFTEEWLTGGLRVLHPKGSMFIFACQHNVGLIDFTLQRMGIEVLHHIVWDKMNTEPNWSGRRLQCSHETIIWAVKQQGYRFNYRYARAMGYPSKRPGVQSRDIWKMPTVGRKEWVGHPAQKPVAIYDRIIDMAGVPGGTLLDVMSGSGTAAISAMRRGMRAVLVEREPEYVAMIKQRVKKERDRGR